MVFVLEPHEFPAGSRLVRPTCVFKLVWENLQPGGHPDFPGLKILTSDFYSQLQSPLVWVKGKAVMLKFSAELTVRIDPPVDLTYVGTDLSIGFYYVTSPLGSRQTLQFDFSPDVVVVREFRQDEDIVRVTRLDSGKYRAHIRACVGPEDQLELVRDLDVAQAQVRKAGGEWRD